MLTQYRIGFGADMKGNPVCYEQQQHATDTSRLHTSNIVQEGLAERVWFSKSQSLLLILNIYYRLSGFQSTFLTIHFRYRPTTC